MDIWWEKEGPALSRLPRLAVAAIDADSAAALAATGAFASWLHLGSLPALWSSGYGLMLTHQF